MFCSNSQAHTPPVQEVCGIVQEINVPKRFLVLRCAGGAKPLSLVWLRGAIFLKDGKLANSGELTIGQRIFVFYHRPFFGKPFITKVSW